MGGGVGLDGPESDPCLHVEDQPLWQTPISAAGNVNIGNDAGGCV